MSAILVITLKILNYDKNEEIKNNAWFWLQKRTCLPTIRGGGAMIVKETKFKIIKDLRIANIL